MLLGLLTVGMVLGSGIGAGQRADRLLKPLLLLLLLMLLSPPPSSSSEELPEGTSSLARSTAWWIRRENSLSPRRQLSTTETQNGALCSPYLRRKTKSYIHFLHWIQTPKYHCKECYASFFISGKESIDSYSSELVLGCSINYCKYKQTNKQTVHWF